MSEEGTFLKISIQLLTFKDMHDLIEVILVCLLVLGVDKNIIKIDHHELANEWSEDLIH